jgi:hypothetical protein
VRYEKRTWRSRVLRYGLHLPNVLAVKVSVAAVIIYTI